MKNCSEFSAQVAIEEDGQERMKKKMRTLTPKEVVVIRPQPAVMINHGEVSVPASENQPATEPK